MQKIIVRNFGPIEEAEIEIKGLTILIGEQASGKSTLAKLIYFFKTFKKDLYNLARYKSESFEDQTNTKELADKVIENFKSKFKQYFGSTSKLGPNYYLEFQFYQTISITITPVGNNSFNIAFDKDTFFQIIRSLRINTPHISRLIQNNDFDGLRFYENRLIEDLDRLFSDNYEPLFVPAGRNITVSYPQEFKDYFLSGLSSSGASNTSIDMELMRNFLIRVAKIQDRFNNQNFRSVANEQVNVNGDSTDRINQAISLVPKVLKGNYSNVDGRSEVIRIIGNRVIPISQSSTGQQEALRILQDIFLCLVDNKPVFRVIEEPEAHLFPIAQNQIMQMVSLLSGSGEHQIVITTHSPYVLTACNNLLYPQRIMNRIQGSNGSLSSQLNGIMPSSFWLNPAKFSAYTLRNGVCEPIFYENEGLIRENYLDEVFATMGVEYDAMYNIYADALTQS
jgi:predicted ATP-binding protein involved in virulence